MFEYSKLQLPSAIFVVYFDQQEGAVHSQFQSKSAFSHVFVRFRCRNDKKLGKNKILNKYFCDLGPRSVLKRELLCFI